VLHAAATCDDPAADLLAMLCDPSWVYRQYDHQLFLNTVVGPGGDATVLRLRHPDSGVDTGRGLALTTDGNHRWCAVDPRVGTAMIVAESMLNLAVVGASPLALVNCLNFGNPEHPEVMWQLSESIDGMADACTAFGIPVVGGNVSLYNESAGVNIDPTPVVGLLGMVDQLETVPPGPTLIDGGRLVVIGPPVQHELAGSAWAAEKGQRGGGLPSLDFAVHAEVARVVAQLVTGGLVAGAHDVADGGLGVTIAEMVARSNIGATVARVADHVELFAESPSRVVVCVAPDDLTTVLNVCETAGVGTARIGVAGGDRLAVKGLLDVGVAEVVDAWKGRLPDALAGGTTQG
jgi:phosphoribosylformylglycinamidine synthase